MNQQLKMVRDFHEAFGYAQDTSVMSQKVVCARMSFIAEELAEILHSMASGNREKQLDGAVDLSYFTLGTLAIMGEDVYEPDGGYTFVLDEEIAGKQIHLRTLVDAVNKAIFTFTFWDDPLAMQVLVKHLAYLHACCINFARREVRADFYGAFEEVQRSNMSKLDANGHPIYNEAGKIMKGVNFSEPVLHPFLYA